MGAIRGTVIAALVALVFAPQADARGWSKPRTIAAPVEADLFGGAVVSAGPRGQLAAGWTQTEGVGVAYARRGGRFGRPALVPHSAGEYDPLLGIDAAGNTTIAWAYDFTCADGEDVCSGVRALARLRNGTFTRRTTLTSERFELLGYDVKVSPGGHAAVWWDAYDPVTGALGRGTGVRLARRPGRFGRTQIRNRTIAAWTFDRRGRNAQVVFQSKHSLVAYTRTPDGRLRHRHVLVTVREPDFYAYEIEADSRGVVSAAWQTVRPGHGRPDVPSFVVGVRTLHGRLGAQTLARDPGHSEVASTVVGSGPTGFEVAAWGIRGRNRRSSSYDPDAGVFEKEVHAAVRLPGRRFGRSQRLEPLHPERPVYGVDAAAGPRSAVVTWRGTRADGAQGIYAAHAGPHGHFGKPRLLTADSTGAMSNPSVVVDGGDNATVVWVDGLRVRAARFSSR